MIGKLTTVLVFTGDPVDSIPAPGPAPTIKYVG